MGRQRTTPPPPPHPHAHAHTNKYMGTVNDWNYDGSCTLTSLAVWDVENFGCQNFVAQSVHALIKCLLKLMTNEVNCFVV